MLAPVIRPAAPIRAKYEARLLTLINEMNASVVYWIAAEWRGNEPETVIAGADETPVEALKVTLRRLGRKWIKRFDELSPTLAEYFAKSVKDRCDRALAEALRKGGMSVRFKMTPVMRDAFNAVHATNVGLIKSIPEQYLGQVETLVMQSVSRGGDLGSLTKALQHQYGVTRRRASLIARHQNNMATAVMRRARELDIGITEGKWLHSAGGKHPRAQHVAFSGKRFKIAEGHDFGDGAGNVMPGELINCRCTWRAVVPGFDD